MAFCRRNPEADAHQPIAVKQTRPLHGPSEGLMLPLT